MKTVILTTCMVGPRASYAIGDAYQAPSEDQAKRLIDAGLAKWPEEEQTATPKETQKAAAKSKGDGAK